MIKNIFQYIVFLAFISNPLISQSTNKNFYAESKKNFLNNTKEILKSENFDSLRIYLVTISPGVTVSTAFGHTALRLQFGKDDYDSKDFYVDFGQYDESLIFFWKFLRGNAGFYFSVVPTASAYEAWDASGRGFQVSEFIMTLEQKKIMLLEILKLFDTVDGYEYNNFKSNCVTFVRDLIDKTYSRKLELADSVLQNTGRKIAIRFSDKILWLIIEAKLLFDHDTDKIRTSSDLIFLPMDLQISVEDAKITKDPKTLIPNRWQSSSSLDFIGYFTFFLFIFIIVSQFPIGIFVTYKRYGQVIFAWLSGLGGSFALLVFLVTSFDFMDENIVVLAFTPLDFLLLNKNFSENPHFKKFLFLRLLILGIAFFLRLTFYKQDIDFILFFSFLFFGFLTYNAFSKKVEQVNA